MGMSTVLAKSSILSFILNGRVLPLAAAVESLAWVLLPRGVEVDSVGSM